MLQAHTLRFDKMEAAMANFSQSLQLMKQEISNVDKRHSTEIGSLRADLNAEVNALKQENLNLDFVLYGLPQEISNENAVEIVKKFTEAIGEPIANDDISKCYVRKNTARNEAQIIGSFTSTRAKDRTMRNFIAKRPVAVEDIMNIPERSQWRGKPVTIRNQLTALNRKLLGEALRRNNGRFKFIWESRGRILLRKAENDRPTCVQSMEQLDSVLPVEDTHHQQSNRPLRLNN